MARWDPWKELQTLRKEIDRVFENAAFGVPPLFRAAFLPGEASNLYPMVNLHEDKENLYLEALAPGIDPGSLKLTAQRNSVTLSGEKRRAPERVQGEAFHRRERGAGSFTRRVDLPVEIDEANVKAEYRDGLLLITLPKAPKAKPREITVQVG